MKFAFLRALIISLFCFPFVAALNSATAIEIQITENGAVEFYEDTVLGKNTGPNASNNANANRNNSPTKHVAPAEQKLLRIQNRNDNVRVGIESKENTTQTDELESGQLHLSIPANIRPREQAEERTTGSNNNNVRVDQQPRVRQLEQNNANRDQQQTIERVRQERQERTQEQVEILRPDTPGIDQLELRSRGVQARLQQGAEFVVDPETNTVTVTTPAGISHELNHLPDQAIENMVAAGVISDDTATPSAISLVEDDGAIVYETTAVEERRLFGLFSRRIPTQVRLNDATGEVESEPIPGNNFVERLLDRLSF